MKKVKNIKVLSKGILCAVVGLTTLTGCFSDGKDGSAGVAGSNGAIWFYGDGDPNSSIGNIGDFYFETDDGDVWLKSEAGWNVVSNLIGNQGVTGNQGTNAYVVEYRNNGTHLQWKYTHESEWKDLVSLDDITGEDGKDGNDIYIGYDGYIWSGTTKTDLVFTELGLDVAENTLELLTNKYFDTEVIAAGEKVVLMGNYMPSTKRTQYTHSIIKKITTYVTTDGTLDIGVLNLDTNTYTKKETVDVEKGKNVLDVEIAVGENETLVLGGETTTVGLYKSTGVTNNDEFGVYSTNTDTLVLEKTDGVNDKVIVNVELKSNFFTEYRVFDNLTTKFPDSSISSLKEVSDEHGPYSYQNTTLVSGKHVTKIGIPVKTVTAIDDKQYVSVHVINNDTLAGLKPATIKETYKLYIPLEEIGESTTLNKWVYIDCDIELAENETLAFSLGDDPVNWGYIGANNTEEAFRFYCKVAGTGTGKASNAEGIIFDIYYKEGSDRSFADHLAALKNAEN